jgi:hypothetical protein
MKKVLFSAFLVAMISTSSFAQGVKTSITKNISIEFPGQPVQTDMGPSTLRVLKLPDSTANFNVVVTDLEKAAAVTPEALQQAMQDPGFWDQTEQGFMSQVGAKAKLVSKQVKRINGVDFLELVVDVPSLAGPINRLTVWIIVDGMNTINVIHNSRGGKGDELKKEKYFSSLTIAQGK